MRTYFIAVGCGLLALLGVGAELVTSAGATSPVTLQDLPGLGYSLSLQGNPQTGCSNYVVIAGNGVTTDQLIGDIPPSCATAQQEQDRIDALLAAYPPIPPTTATPTTAPPVTVTISETVTSPPETVTVPTTVTIPTVQTVTAPPVTVTERVEVPVTATVTAPAVTVMQTSTVVRRVTVKAKRRVAVPRARMTR